MERHIWKKYGTGEVNDKIIYWVDLWNDLVDHFTKDHYGLELDNPHVLLLVLVDEIEYDELRNEEVRKYLLEGLGKALKVDPVVKKEIPTEFSLLLHAFNNQALYYLLRTCKSILPFFQGGRYFHETFNVLRASLSDPNWKSGEEEQIRSLTNSLIVELLLKGYGLKSIREMPRNIFWKDFRP